VFSGNVVLDESHEIMPIYEYENTKTGGRFTENLPIDKRNFPARRRFIRRVISAPKISVISDMGGKEDKAREQIMQAAEKDISNVKRKKLKRQSGQKKDGKKASKKDAGSDPYGLAEAWWKIFTKPNVTRKNTK